MKPKEKAKELIDRFILYTETEWNNILIAKQCALIAVDEILKELDGFNDEYGFQFSRVEYYKEVKQEIENYDNSAN